MEHPPWHNPVRELAQNVHLTKKQTVVLVEKLAVLGGLRIC